MNFWNRRLDLLENISLDNGKTPIIRLRGSYFHVGKSLYSVLKELEDRGLIVRVKEGTSIRNYTTEKGDRLIKILRELKEVWSYES